jgi:hypothetical protein
MLLAIEAGMEMCKSMWPYMGDESFWIVIPDEGRPRAEEGVVPRRRPGDLCVALYHRGYYAGFVSCDVGSDHVFAANCREVWEEKDLVLPEEPGGPGDPGRN